MVVGWQWLCSHKVPKGFFWRANIAMNTLPSSISSEKIIQKAVSVPGSCGLSSSEEASGSCKTLHWLLSTSTYHSMDWLDVSYPHVNFHIINAMSLPTWPSLCLAQLHPDTPTLSYLWLSKSICPWIDSSLYRHCLLLVLFRQLWLTHPALKGPACCGQYCE